MKNIITLTVLGLFAMTLLGCPGGVSTDDYKAVWKGAIDSYYKDLKDGKKADAIDDIAKRLDKGAKEKGAKDWADLGLQVAKADAEGCTKVGKEMGEYQVKVATDYSKSLTEKKPEKPAEKPAEK